ncbi:MAG: hypothetical protein R3F46_01310 [bacterium]
MSKLVLALLCAVVIVLSASCCHKSNDTVLPQQQSALPASVLPA